ncbi:MAG: hypothetical protein P4L58_02930, partial [Candidatus Pacebacteria bacterium]|nr:hypothetical protein [Candidatus Paceibacterota bacterium]
AFEKEENNCDNSMNYAFFLYSHDLDAEAVKVADIHFLNHCVGQVSRPLYYITIFHHGDISRALKISLLTKETDLNISRLLALAALYVEDHQWNNADRTIAVILEKQPKFWVTSHYIETKPLLNALKSECVSENSPSRYCGLPKMAAQR